MKMNSVMSAAVVAALMLPILRLEARPDQGEQHRIREFALQSDATPAVPRLPGTPKGLAVNITAFALPAPAAPSTPPAPSAPSAPPASSAPPAPSAPSAPAAPPAPGSNPPNPRTPVLTPSADAVLPVNPAPLKTQMKGSELMGLAVFNPRNERLGDIHDLMLDLTTGRVSGLIVKFDDRLALVPLTAFRFDAALQLLQLNSSKEALKAFPSP